MSSYYVALRKELQRKSKPCNDQEGHHICTELKTCPSFPLHTHECGKTICAHCSKPCKGWCKSTLLCLKCASENDQFCRVCVSTIRYSSGCN